MCLLRLPAARPHRRLMIRGQLECERCADIAA
jgi:hypothetical protein